MVAINIYVNGRVCGALDTIECESLHVCYA